MYNRIYKMKNYGAIFYNHESPRRTKEYVTQKIVHGVCDIYNNKSKVLYLGDLNAKIDWGYAKDYVEAAWKIMQLKKPDFFVIGTGNCYSVKDFVKKCFSYVNLDYRKFVKINKKLIRPSKTSFLKADTKKAFKFINYNRNKTSLDKLIKIMMDAHLKNNE